MRGKRIAALLAAMALFSTAHVVSARHMAEDYVERVQRERQERMREEAQRARLQEQAESRRRAEETWRSAAAADEDEYDGEDYDYDEDIDEEEARQAEREAEEAAREEERRQEEETRRREEERRKEEETRRREEERLREEAEKRRAEEEAAQEKEREREREAAVEAARAEEEKQRAEAEATAQKEETGTGEGILAQYLRRARERVQGSVPASTETAPELHVAKELPMKRLETESVDTDGTLIFSDCPEYVKEPGILYTDVVKGDARVFYYHLNDTKKKYKVAVVLESVGGQYAVVRVTRRATAAPGNNYFEVGKGLQKAYFTDGQPTEKMYIGPDDRRLLLESMDQTVLKPGELVAGMVDFSASAPVRVSVLFYPKGKDPLEYVSEAKILPPDEHRMRGTFVGMDRILRLKDSYDPDDDGLACVVLADNHHDVYREGVDATDGSLATNYGNYGVVYRLELPVRGKTRFLMSPMGGPYAGVVRAESEKNGSRTISIPGGRLFFGKNTIHPVFSEDGMTTLTPMAELADLGVFSARPREFFEFSPPGASNLPIMMILAPDDVKLVDDKGKTS